tara:strand:- start:504 stop:1028 length:525 start_codon:yes stop_codon:yes gene_type:complete
MIRLHKAIVVLWTFGITSLALFSTSCSNDDAPSQEEKINTMLKEVRKVTSSMRTMESAKKMGWNHALSECVEHPTEGGMGHHIAKKEYMDGRLNHKEPQVLLFASNSNSEELELVGVEYIVPFSVLPSTATAPELYFQKFHKNEEQEIWALHVWTELENPKGTFYDWNPKVSCP